jgi:hypothetical protein
MVTAPPVRGQIFRSLQLRGIEVNVTNQLQKVSVAVTKNRLVTALEQMANGPGPPVIVLRARKLNALQDLG